MLIFYKLLKQKINPSSAVYWFLLINTAFWFLAGFAAGAAAAFFFSPGRLFLPAVTTGALGAIAFGYVYGAIIAVREA